MYVNTIQKWLQNYIQCNFESAVYWLYIQAFICTCVVPEHIHTPTMEGISYIPANSPGFPGSLQVFHEISPSPG